MKGVHAIFFRIHFLKEMEEYCNENKLSFQRLHSHHPDEVHLKVFGAFSYSKTWCTDLLAYLNRLNVDFDIYTKTIDSYTPIYPSICYAA